MCSEKRQNHSNSTYGKKLIGNIEIVFLHIQKVSPKLSIKKSQVGQQTVYFSGKTISSTGVAPIKDRKTKSLKKIQTPEQQNSIAAFFRLFDDSIFLSQPLSPFLIISQKRHSLPVTAITQRYIFEFFSFLVKAKTLLLYMPHNQLVIFFEKGYALL